MKQDWPSVHVHVQFITSNMCSCLTHMLFQLQVERLPQAKGRKSGSLTSLHEIVAAGKGRTVVKVKT